jgi:CheY-like chemotaxis protein
MPYLGGIELCELLRQQEAHCDVPIVFLASGALSVDSEELDQLSVTAILPKPFSPRQLLSIVERQLAARPEIQAESTAV